MNRPEQAHRIPACLSDCEQAALSGALRLNCLKVGLNGIPGEIVSPPIRRRRQSDL